jgi:hypothetical protein
LQAKPNLQPLSHTSTISNTGALFLDQQEYQETITKIPAQATSDHGHLEEHQELIQRRSRAARKEEQGYQQNKKDQEEQSCQKIK